MNEFEKAYLAMSKEIVFHANEFVITPSTLSTTSNKTLYCSIKTKIFYDRNSEKIFLFTYDKDILDCESLLKDINMLTKQDKVSLNEYNIAIFLESYLLLGSKETADNPLYFGEVDSKELDSKGTLDKTKPIYFLESVNYHFEHSKKSHNDLESSDEFNLDSNITTSNQSNNQSNNNRANSKSLSNIESNPTSPIHKGSSTLKIFLNDSTLTILNYSLLDSSLNIKLECTSKEYKEILNKEQALRDKQESKAKDSTNDETISTAMLHPVLEDNEIKCPHGGVVKLKAK